VKFPEKEFEVVYGKLGAYDIKDGARWGFEEARKQMLAKIKKKQQRIREYEINLEAVSVLEGVKEPDIVDWKTELKLTLEWLEGELKVDSASVEADAVKEVGLK